MPLCDFWLLISFSVMGTLSSEKRDVHCIKHLHTICEIQIPYPDLQFLVDFPLKFIFLGPVPAVCLI